MASHVLELPRNVESVRRWLEVVSHIDPRYGGIGATVPMLGKHIADMQDMDVSLAAFTSPEENFRPAHFCSEHLSFWPAGRRAWLRNEDLRSSFTSEIRKANGIHIHGLWEQSTAVAAKTARSLNVPYILSAHGMLEPWALATKRIKKSVYGRFIERRNVAGAACLHALTRVEAGQFRSYGAQSPIAIIPNGVDIPQFRDPLLMLNRFPLLKGKRIVLFLARLHPKKGIDLLLRAWVEVSRCFPDAHLLLAGPGMPAIEEKLHQFIARENMSSSVLITGMLRDRLKWSALSIAECFVLPSYSEGLSVSILEAMGMGLPVLITKPCNMPEVERLGAGWEIQVELPALINALTNILKQSPKANADTGSRGAALIRKRYTWPIVAEQMAEVYRWIDGDRKPTAVEVVYPE
jgi:glycosyltransferase involved in cell wall biosynthesis